MRLLQAIRKPPRYVVWRLVRELRAETDRVFAPRRARSFDDQALLRATQSPDLATLWDQLGERSYLAPMTIDLARLDALCPGEAERVRAAATEAKARRVQFLGSAPTELGRPIDWSRDFKSGRVWPRRYFRDIPMVHRDDRSDVTVPWELSRLQWLLPAAQAFLLDRDESHAFAVRQVLEEWIDANPYAQSVNWGCAMEAALRVWSWTYLFHSFHASQAWQPPAFRSAFLRALYLHADFVERFLERSDQNGNHYTADAAGLLCAGLFFGAGEAPHRWQRLGWTILREELPRQVGADGVDIEASTAYHRLVLELFLLPALYRRAHGLPVDDDYRDRLVAMARFVAAYSRPDGSTPLWGDADDARALPLGGQGLGDHRYLVGLVGGAFQVDELIEQFDGPRSEIFWLLGPQRAAELRASVVAPGSARFGESGVVILRNEQDHVFVDCGPVGFRGRGGHGHNDCLSFEAYLAGRPLITDSGTFTYTGDFAERNRFRSTRAHNTPQVDDAEINRLPADDLWSLGNQAQPDLRRFHSRRDHDLFVGAHTGYRRLPDPVTPVRTLWLDHALHALVLRDAFECRGPHRAQVSIRLAPGVDAEILDPGALRLTAIGQAFVVTWGPTTAWRLEVGRGEISPSYGVKTEVVRLNFLVEGTLRDPLVVCFVPESDAPADPLAWARQQLARADEEGGSTP